MEVVEILLVVDNQIFVIIINGMVYYLFVIWCGEYWVLDFVDSNGFVIILGMLMIMGVDLLVQY